MKEFCVYKKPNNFTDQCNKPCYCDNEGNEVCTDTCEYNIENCNNATHTLVYDDEGDECSCPRCEPKTEPCTAVPDKKETLNFTDSTSGICVSDELDLMKCQGTCGMSTTTGNQRSKSPRTRQTQASPWSQNQTAPVARQTSARKTWHLNVPTKPKNRSLSLTSSPAHVCCADLSKPTTVTPTVAQTASANYILFQS